MAIELLKRGANVEAKDDHGCTPFLKAVKHDAPECLLDLHLERSANAHAVADDRKTALHFAAQKDKAKIIRQMINKGLSVNAVDKDGWTPLHEAAYYGSRDAVAVLIKNGQSNATAMVLVFLLYDLYYSGHQGTYSAPCPI